MALKNNSSVLISLRIPNDLFQRLPRPVTEPPGKAGVGRNGAIIDLLRRAMDEKKPEDDQNASPAFFHSQ